MNWTNSMKDRIPKIEKDNLNSLISTKEIDCILKKNLFIWDATSGRWNRFFSTLPKYKKLITIQFKNG